MSMIARSPSLKHFNVRLSNRTAAFLTVSGTLAAVGAYKLKQDEGLQRAVYFYSVALIPLIKYRYYDWKTKEWPEEKRSALFHTLHEANVPVTVATIMKLQGFYIKLGQIMSGLDGLIPEEFTSALKVFQNDCPKRDVSEVVATIEAELGKPFNEIFLSIDPKPLGSASIGQVHKAQLLNGQTVCVKVQHPDAERFFRIDVATTRSFTALAQPEQLVVFDEIEKNFVSEFDYVREAQNLLEMNEALNSHAEFKRAVVVPVPLLYTRKVLVMTYLDGETLQHKQKRYFQEVAEKEHKTVEQVEAELREKNTGDSKPSAKPPSNAVIKAYRSFLLGRDYVKNGFCLTYNLAFGYLSGSPLKYEWTELPMKSGEALDLLYSFFGYTLFKFGKFSSDPHGGNVMHIKGEKLGLIDMGQIKRLDLDTRLRFARLVVALAKDKGSKEDNAEIAKLWRQCGYQTKLSNDELTADVARFNFDRLSDDLVNKYGGIEVIFENWEKIDPLIKTPDDYIMASRLSLLIRMNALGLGHGGAGTKHERVCPMWAPYAKELLREHGEVV